MLNKKNKYKNEIQKIFHQKKMIYDYKIFSDN